MKQPEAGLFSPSMAQLFRRLSPDQRDALVGAFLSGGSADEQVGKIEDALRADDGRTLKTAIGNWVTAIIPVEVLVTDAHQKWRPLVQDSFRFLFSHLSARRLAWKIVEQVALAPGT